MSNGSLASNGFFSSITSLFNGANGADNGSSSSSSHNGYQERKRSAFGSGLPNSMRRGPPSSLEDNGAWSLPYTHYSKQSKSSATPNGQYPPTHSPIATTFSAYGSSATVNVADQANQSSATLVPAQGRPSITLSSNVSIPSTAYPSLKHTWKRIRTWCDSNYSELADTLNWPATEAQLDDLESIIGFTLPPAVRDSYMIYDGQEIESNNSCSDGLFFGLPLLSLDAIADEWNFWRSVDEDPSSGANTEVKGWMSSCPSGWIRPQYSCRGWIPLVTDRVGNYIGVDLSPSPGGGGSPGQVILFGRDFDTKIVLWRGEGEGGWGRFLQYVVEELEGGELWSLEDTSSADSNDEEDTIGYESYFSNGGSGASKGGGDRGGDGNNVGFRLRGEYKGWPVLEAWADRSMRCWDEVGLSTGQPSWQVDLPSVLVDQDSESMPQAESSSTSSRRPFRSSQEQSHPLAETTDSGISNTLSPPVPSSKAGRSKQKRREEASWPTQGNLSPTTSQGRQANPPPQRKGPPAPAAPLDLPTIDDVRAAHAAAMATQQKSGGAFHYDAERGRPPAGMGGMGMGMGVASTAVSPQYNSRYAHRKTPPRDIKISMNPRDEVELENRSSTDVLNPGNRNSSISTLDDNLIDHRKSSSSSMESPRASITIDGRPQIGRSNTGRILYSPGVSEGQRSVENLIDATSATDLNATAESKATPATKAGSFISSPLASHSPVFSSLQSEQMRDQSATPAPVPAIISS
ncbi:hypothetical protein CBS101457_006308 [Exobasidium rhododendri]|nr:hypothetical protein CBS101457_006308 [Exobasidium rhododendri]